MGNFKGVIFDLDGVLVDTVKFHFFAWRKLANDLGFDIDQEQNEQLKGVSRVHSLKRILQWGGKTVSDEDFEILLANKNRDYLASISSMSEQDLLPGVAEVIDYLGTRNIPMALGSASKNARPILKKLGIYDRFEVIVDGNDVENAKPDPEVFLTAAEKLELKPQRCMVIEDSIAGVKAANRAGMLSIAIGDKDVLRKADYNFSAFSEIDRKFLENLLDNEH